MRQTEYEPPKEPDRINHPGHYTFATLPNGTPIECIDVIEALNPGYHLGNCIKYLWRNPYNGKQIEDLKKARWYLDRYIELLETVK